MLTMLMRSVFDEIRRTLITGHRIRSTGRYGLGSHEGERRASLTAELDLTIRTYLGTAPVGRTSTLPSG
jgi:hypothetical protein